MNGWSWEYVEQTVTARRLDAIIAAMKPPEPDRRRLTFEEFRSRYPNGINV